MPGARQPPGWSARAGNNATEVKPAGFISGWSGRQSRADPIRSRSMPRTGNHPVPFMFVTMLANQ